MNITAKKLSGMQQQAYELIAHHPSVFRIGTIVLLMRYVSSLLSIAFYVCGIVVIARLSPTVKLTVDNIMIPNVYIGIALIAIGIFIQAIAWLCRVIQKRNWYILNSFEVLDWVSSLPLEEEDKNVITGEQELIRSSDDNILLTSHRIVDRTPIIDNEMHLKDVLAYKIHHKKQKYYITLSVFFAALLVMACLFGLKQWQTGQEPDVTAIFLFISFPALFFVLSLLCLFSWTRTIFKIHGKFRSFEIDVHGFKRADLKAFIHAFSQQVGARKKR